MASTLCRAAIWALLHRNLHMPCTILPIMCSVEYSTIHTSSTKSQEEKTHKRAPAAHHTLHAALAASRAFSFAFSSLVFRAISLPTKMSSICALLSVSYLRSPWALRVRVAQGTLSNSNKAANTSVPHTLARRWSSSTLSVRIFLAFFSAVLNSVATSFSTAWSVSSKE